jgi:AcrR family transcriptional regulator
MSLVKLDSLNIESSGPELNRREKILLIASKFFLNKGYLATSIDEIAEAAGTTGSALYRVFESKQDILESICVIGIDMKLKGVQEAIGRSYSDPRETLHHLVKNRIDFAFGPWGCQVPIMEAEYQHLSPAAARKVDTAKEVNRCEWFRCLSQIRPETPTRKILTIIYAVLAQITYFGLHIDDLKLEEDVRSIVQRIAWAGLTVTLPMSSV